MDGETILCIAPRVWQSLWRSSHQYMSRLATRNRVLYFEPGRNPDRRHSAELWRNLPNVYGLQIEEVQPNLFVIPTPPCLPYARKHLPASVLRQTTPLVARVNAAIVARQVRRAMRALSVVDPILWLYEPRERHLIGKFGERLTCYFNYDEFADFLDNVKIRSLIRQYDDDLVRAVDVVFASSRAQWERRRAINPNTYFIPNGVNFDLFNRALDPSEPVATELTSLPRPIIGYAGWLGYQLDVDLLIRIAEHYRHGSLVLVGPDELRDVAGRQRLRAMTNVHFLGRKEPVELPRYLKAFDVALLPYTLMGHTGSVYPLKLHEYLSAGRAIVATNLPELAPFENIVRIARTHEAFLEQIGHAINDYSPAIVDERVRIARHNTWDDRISEIHQILDGHLSAKRTGRETALSSLDPIRSA